MLEKQNPFKNEFFKYIGLITQLGSSVILSIILCILGFVYLDRKFHTNGILIIPGVILGVLLGMVMAYRQLKKYYKTTDKSSNE
jgi:F0F1-type ATP synthase assembly protein I